ncbi:TolC family protein [Candidatus Nitrospira allomarina]|uniref:TolC family protein n=1 Tax=Candidatus Nitrospira allomarina TaxID=3020900 RepID=A0AA96GFB4_9BACT|nr:TolC family protein [Candidatus Nitrospira allomarina]WNM57604.1 TolC family protein [Candidatus Nitrospira allomarina]
MIKISMAGLGWPILVFGLGFSGCAIPFHDNQMDELPRPNMYPQKGIPTLFPDLQNEKHLHTVPAEGQTQADDEHDDGTLSLPRLKNLARKNNPTLIQAWVLVEGERAKALQAGLYPNPVGGYSGDQINVKNTIGEFQGGFIQQEFVTAGKLELSREKYLARASAAEYQALAQEYRVMNGIVIQYYRLLGFQERVDIQRELLKSWQDQLLTVKEMFNVGQANEADLRQARVQLQQQQLSVLMAENEFQMERERLMALVGTSLPNQAVSGMLAEDLPPIRFEEALKRLLQESPELALAHANVRSDQIMVQREQAEPIPNITLRGSAGRNYVETQTVYGIQAFIKIPIFDWNQGTIQQARADLRRQEAQVTLTELRLRRSLAEQFQQYLTALQHITSYRDFLLPESEARYRVQLQSYQSDRETWPEVLQAQRDFFMLRLEYINQLIAWRTARVTIEGLLLIDGLQAPQGVTPPGHLDANPKPR